MRNLLLMNAAVHPFRIFNASAGSGKTYTLTREYLKLLLAPGSGQAFREILAITFTNKAVGELKSRILTSLEAFSKVPDENNLPDLFKELADGLKMTPMQLKQRAGRVLQEILHNYAFFDVSTIDKFYYRVIRTFSRDLNLPPHFEVLMDTDLVLQKAVDALIQKAGDDLELTKVLITFALEKSAEDKSWDIRRELMRIGKILFDETNGIILDGFRNKEMEDFVSLRVHLQAKISVCEAQLRGITSELLALFNSRGLERLDFYRGLFPDFLKNISAGKFDQNFVAGWKQRFGTEPLYSAKTPASSKAEIDNLMENLTVQFFRIKAILTTRNFLVNAASNMAPFTVLGMLELEVERILRDESLVPISRFNSLVAHELADQPTPYIYERLGEKYRHYFIDEFQDTSLLQWQNLIPLIGNALEGEDADGKRGSLVLVGDAKQAIYRWRGGEAEQFLRLSNLNSPFVITPEVENLPKNFRSHKNIVSFNNSFFQHVSGFLGNAEYAQLFRSGNDQGVASSGTGFVSLEFIESDPEALNNPYLERCLELITEVTDRGFTYQDICFLTRKRKEGVLISNHLIKAGIPVVSSETLLLKNNQSVRFLIALLYHLTDPEDGHYNYAILEFLAPEGPEMHSWILDRLHCMSAFLQKDFNLTSSTLSRLSVYDIFETAIRTFELYGQEDAYLINLLDLALEIGHAENTGVGTFLKYWELKEDSLSISAPEGLNAVRLMTIHKSKGLEFPVVIYPFANTDFYSELNGKLWAPVPQEDYLNFPYLQISKKKELADYESTIANLYVEDRHKLELDAFNVLYVAHTRAIAALFVLTEETQSKDPIPKTYGDLYVGYLTMLGNWNPEQRHYHWGEILYTGKPSVEIQGNHINLKALSDHPTVCHLVTRSSALWGSSLEVARQRGTFLHYGLSLLNSPEDISIVSKELIAAGLLAPMDAKYFETICAKLVNHPSLQSYYTLDWEVFAEHDILAKNGIILRPDRLLIQNNIAVLMDYKTGAPKPADKNQILEYSAAVEEMGYTVTHRVLIYISEETITPEFI
ncbi:UvrD-helicase domain-containing protein [Robiginitalea sp.]|nr:UvrD-helicase domain-containing protein [Robiginitalea sp.]